MATRKAGFFTRAFKRVGAVLGLVGIGVLGALGAIASVIVSPITLALGVLLSNGKPAMLPMMLSLPMWPAMFLDRSYRSELISIVKGTSHDADDFDDSRPEELKRKIDIDQQIERNETAVNSTNVGLHDHLRTDRRSSPLAQAAITDMPRTPFPPRIVHFNVEQEKGESVNFNLDLKIVQDITQNWQIRAHYKEEPKGTHVLTFPDAVSARAFVDYLASKGIVASTSHDLGPVPLTRATSTSGPVPISLSQNTMSKPLSSGPQEPVSNSDTDPLKLR